MPVNFLSLPGGLSLLWYFLEKGAEFFGAWGVFPYPCYNSRGSGPYSFNSRCHTGIADMWLDRKPVSGVNGCSTKVILKQDVNKIALPEK